MTCYTGPRPELNRGLRDVGMCHNHQATGHPSISNVDILGIGIGIGLNITAGNGIAIITGMVLICVVVALLVMDLIVPKASQ